MKETIASNFVGLRGSLQRADMTNEQVNATDVGLLAVVVSESVSIDAQVDHDVEFTFSDGSTLFVDDLDNMWSASQLGDADDISLLASELLNFADGQDDALADLCTRAAEALNGGITVHLQDAMQEGPPYRQIACRITADRCGIYLRPEGYGDYCSADGRGCPVMIEFHNGELRLVVWDDINEEDKVQYISLEGAREDVREDDEADNTPDL